MRSLGENALKKRYEKGTALSRSIALRSSTKLRSSDLGQLGHGSALILGQAAEPRRGNAAPGELS